MKRKPKFEVGDEVRSVRVGRVPALSGKIAGRVREDYWDVVYADGVTWLRSDEELMRVRRS